MSLNFITEPWLVFVSCLSAVCHDLSELIVDAAIAPASALDITSKTTVEMALWRVVVLRNQAPRVFDYITVTAITITPIPENR